MKKKTLVSILAVASAPMAGYANANLDQIKTDATTDWTGPDDLRLESGVLTSPSGLAVSQNIGNLLPGRYQLTAGSGSSANIRISVDGVVFENNQFELDAEREVTIRIGSTDGAAFMVAGLQLQLVVDLVATYQTPLLTELAKVQNRINQDGQAAAELNDEVSALSAKIATIKNDGAGQFNAYKVYKDFQLYKGWAESTIMAEINTLAEKVDAQANNAGAYFDAKARWENQQSLLDAAKPVVGNDSWTEDEKKYADIIAKAELDAAQARIDAYKNAVEDAYADGTAGVLCTTEYNAAFESDMTGLIKAYGEKVTAAKADHAPYVEIADRIAALKTTYNAALQNIYKEFEGSEEFPDVYEPVRQEAQTKLNEQYVDILGVERLNGTAEDHTNAAENLVANRNALNVAEAQIAALEAEYVQKAKDLKGAYSDAQVQLKDLQNSLDEVAAFEGVAEGFQETINTIQGLIDAFEAQIKKDNEANTIDKADYTTNVDEINKAIEKLVKDAVGSVDNYNAYKAAQAAIAGVQKALNDAKVRVNALKSTDGKYSVDGRYAAQEAAIQKSLDDFTSAMTDALHNDKCVTWWNDNQDNINGKQTDIANYENTAKDGVAAYNDVVAKLADYDKAIKALEDKVGTNRDVAIYNGDEPTSETYGQRIDGFRNTYNVINKKIEDALLTSSTGDAHYKLLTDARTSAANASDIPAETAALVGTFDVDKAKYDEDVVEIAVERLLNQANAYIAEVEKSLAGWDYTADALGLNYDRLNSAKELVETDLADAKEDVEAARVASDKAQAMGLLSEINTRLVSIRTEIADLLSDAEKVAAAVKANKEANTNATNVVTEIYNQLNGGGNVAKGVVALNADDSRKGEFASKVSDLTARIQEQEAAIAASFTKETLVADWSAINEKLTAIRAEVMEARTAADNSTKNWKAYQNILALDSYKNLQANIDQARTDVEDVTKEPLAPSAQDHYLSIVDDYQDEYDKLIANIETSYATDRDCAGKETEYTNSLNTLNTNVKAVKGNAEANEKAYNEQKGADYYEKVNKHWEDTYYDISTSDQTSAVEGYLNELTQQQTLLANLRNQIDVYFTGGNSVAQDKAVKDALTAISNAITDIANRQTEGYDAAVSADNRARKDAIDAAVSDAREEYTNALNVITEFTQLQLQNAALVDLLAEYVGVANESINGYLTRLRTIESNAQADFDAAQTADPTAIFDENQNYLQQANAIAQGIEDALEKMNDDVVNNIVNTYFPQQYTAHKALYDAAVQELVDADYTSEVREKAFDDVEAILKAAERDMNGWEGAVEFLPTVVDAHLSAFTQIESMIAVDKENAALAEWTAEITRVEGRRDKELGEMKAWGYPSGFNAEYYIEKYENATSHIENAKNIYAEATAGGTPIYGDVMAELKAELSAFEGVANTAYDAAKRANADKTESNKAYDDIVAELDKVQADWTAAKEYLDKYVVTGQYTTLWNQQDAIDALSDEAAERKELGSCVYFRDVILPMRLNAIQSNLDVIYENANQAEEARILNEFNVLRGEQNKAADAVEGTDKMAEVDAYIEEIDALQNRFTTDITGPNGAIYKAEEKAKQSLYLAYETQMADMRTELTAYYDEAQSANAYNALVEKAAQIEAEWTAASEELNNAEMTHQPVTEEFGADMAAVGVSLNAVKAEIETRNTEGRILFYNDNLTFDLNAVAENLAEVSGAFKAMEAPYDENDAAYVRLTGELKEVQDSLDNTVEKWKGYRYLGQQTWEDEIQPWVDGMQQDIDNDSWRIETLNAEGTGLKSTTQLSYAANVEPNVNYRDRMYTYTELSTTINSDVQNLVNRAYNLIFRSGNLYTAEDWNALDNTYIQLNAATDALVRYNIEAYRNWVTADIDGNPLLDEAGDPISGKSVDYLTEAVQPVWDKIAELTEQLNQLITDAEEKAYTRGDADLDRMVTVNDYMEAISYVVGRQEMPGAETVEFAAADVNNDGKINIGDVTNIANLIRGEQVVTTFTRNSLRSRGAVDRTVATTDAIALSMTQENGVQRIAIRLNNSVNYTGLQLDVKLPAGVTVMNETLGERAEDHELFSNTMADGTHRILVSSLESSEFNNTDDAVIYLEVSGNAASKITVSEVLATDAKGSLYSIGGQGGDGTTGIDGVQATQNLKQRIYSVGGQAMQKLTRGLNIIRNSDGTTKKVLKK